MTDEVEALKKALREVIAACDSGRRYEGGAGGMTIESQIARTKINGVPALPIERARDLLSLLDAGLPPDYYD